LKGFQKSCHYRQIDVVAELSKNHTNTAFLNNETVCSSVGFVANLEQNLHSYHWMFLPT